MGGIVGSTRALQVRSLVPKIVERSGAKNTSILDAKSFDGHREGEAERKREGGNVKFMV